MTRGRIHRTGKKIDNLRWSGGTAISFLAQSAGTSGFTALAAGVPRETIMRTRGEVLVGMDGVSGPGKACLISMGLVLVPQGTGTTVIWDPFGDSEAPWFWFQETFISFEEGVVDAIAYQTLSMSRIIVDTKAMRRANVDEEVQMVVTNTTVDAACVVNTMAAFRFLLGN